MPRKQRFKPSRKPKPTPPSEDALIGQTSATGSGHSDHLTTRDADPGHEQGSSTEPQSEPPSR
jgi:hypothetical protein